MDKRKNGRGRPKKTGEKRTEPVCFFLTPSEKEALMSSLGDRNLSVVVRKLISPLFAPTQEMERA